MANKTWFVTHCRKFWLEGLAFFWGGKKLHWVSRLWENLPLNGEWCQNFFPTLLCITGLLRHSKKKVVKIGETIHNNTAHLTPKPNLVPLRNGKAQNVWQYLPQLTLYFETELLLLTISLLVTVPHSQGSFWILIYMTVTDQLLIKEHLTCHPDSKQPDISALLSTWHLLRLQHLQHLPSNMKLKKKTRD